MFRAVGTVVEAIFKAYSQQRYHLAVGNAANGLDFPTLDTDLKVTSLRQPPEDKNVPLDEVSRRQLAERIVDEVPEQGVLTISNALQWRLQYSRAISTAITGTNAPEVVDLRAEQ